MGNRVMVVDDSRVTYLQMQKLLENTNYEIAAYCQDGETAIDQYNEIHPDVVTMDIIMPGMDGLETARTIIEDHPDAKIVMLSSLAYDDTIDEANEIGAKGFIFKPFESEQVLSALDKALAEA
ncbi:MAG: response regulator [Hespellia sp.]|nr:response regulator [Hespellia sp.]